MTQRRTHGLIGRLFKAILLRATELLFALALVVLFFAICLGVYSISFPEGTSISDLFRREDPSADSWSDPRVVLDTDRSLVDDPLFVARLSQILRTVKDKPNGAIAWSTSQSGGRLGNHHAIQSFADSAAVITFDDQSNLRMGENSLIVIRSTQRRGRSPQRVASLVVLEGELSGRVRGYQQDPLRIDVVTSNARVSLDSDPGKTADFTITTSPDDSSTYTIYEGVAVVRTDTQVLKVGPEESVSIDADGVIHTPQPLPDLPEPLSPPDGHVAQYRTSPPRVAFGWRASGPVDAFHFELARDRDFRQVLHHEVLTAPEFIHGHLKPGNYYWRVTSITNSARGEPSPVMGFAVMQDREAPILRVRFPDERVAAPVFELAGEVEPGTDVFIGDHRIEVQPDGQFLHPLPLQQGLNVVVVEAIDVAGNVTYESRLVHATYPSEEKKP